MIYCYCCNEILQIRSSIMKLKILFITIIGVLLVNPVLAAEKTTKKTMSSQQIKMKDCNIQAKKKSLEGQKRKSFMQSCLSSKPSKKNNSQNEKMIKCNAEAGKIKFKEGERKIFMSKCLRD